MNVTASVRLELYDLPQTYFVHAQTINLTAFQHTPFFFWQCYNFCSWHDTHDF